MHVLFVSTEMAPLTNGGAGMVVTRLRKNLADDGHTVSVLVVANDVGEVPGGVTVVPSHGDALSRAKTAAAAVDGFLDSNQVDLIEIQDFDGLGFWLLAHRSRIGVEGIPIQVRFHGTADLMFESIGSQPSELGVMRVMEKGALAMADRVIVPSSGIAELVTSRYDLEPERTTIGTPPLPVENRSWSPSSDPTLVSVGRLGEVKGTHDLIAAATPVLRRHRECQLILLGEDGWSASTSQLMSTWLEEGLVEDDIRSQVVWLGRLEGEEFRSVISAAWAVVAPSRFESFHLGVHESRQIGAPVIVPAIPAFVDIFGEATGGLVYENVDDGLTAAMEAIVSDTGLRDQLAGAPPPAISAPLSAYASLPQVRHQRAQAGLATIAVKELESWQNVEGQGGSEVPRHRFRNMARTLVLSLPDRFISAVVTIVPKQWLGSSTFATEMKTSKWQSMERDAEQGRQSARSTLMERIGRGDFPDIDDPLVSVVIPVHNDAEFIDEAIESVFYQTESSFEIVVVNDGSTDSESLKILERLAWPRTTVINQSNHGLAAARNVGVAASHGRFIVPLDVDDAIEPRFLEAQLDVLAEHESTAYTTTWSRLTGDVDAVWIPRPFNDYQILLSNSNVGCVVLRRSAFDSVGGYNEEMRSGNEDWDLWLRLMAAGHTMIEVPEVLFRYRKHGITMSVRTEARYESARSEMVESHPDLYENTALRNRKRDLYPALSIVVSDAALLPSALRQSISDAEVLLVGLADPGQRQVEAVAGLRFSTFNSIDAAIDAAIGKYVTIWAPIGEPEPQLLHDLVTALEGASDAGVATTLADTPLTVVRRWSLADREAPAATVSIASGTAATRSLRAGERLDDAWQKPTEVDGLPVHRQRPEEAAFVPDWITP